MKYFLRNIKAGNCKDLVGKVLSPFYDLGCKMTIKVHFLSVSDKFQENLGAVSYEQGERFRLDLMTTDECYQGKWDRQMVADYCWSIKRDCSKKRTNARVASAKFCPGTGACK